MTKLEDKRLMIERKKAEIRAVKAAAYGQDEHRARIGSGLAHMEEQARRTLRMQTLNGELPFFAHAGTPRGMEVGHMLVLLLGRDRMAQALGRFVDDLPESMPDDARHELIARLDSELYQLEDDEEAEICRLEALGYVTDRRGDARPEIVLRVRD
jgi:hypothetical protein